MSSYDSNWPLAVINCPWRSSVLIYILMLMYMYRQGSKETKLLYLVAIGWLFYVLYVLFKLTHIACPCYFIYYKYLAICKWDYVYAAHNYRKINSDRVIKDHVIMITLSGFILCLWLNGCTLSMMPKFISFLTKPNF